MADGDVGFGAIVTFAGAGSTGLTVNVRDISFSGFTRNSVDISHNRTTAMQYIPAGSYDPGSLTLDVVMPMNSTDYSTQIIAGLRSPNATLTVVCQTPSTLFTTGMTFSGTGHMTGFTPSIPGQAENTAQITFKLSGVPTVSGPG